MRTDPYKISNLDPCNQPCPNDAGRFHKEIEKLGQEFNQPLRLVWGPDVYATLWGERRRRYAQSYHAPCEHLRGWWIGKLEEVETDGKKQMLFAPRQKVKADRFTADPHSGFYLPNGDWVQADLDVRLVSEPRWIVEFKLPDREKHFHNLERYDYESERHVERREVYDRKKGEFVQKEYEYEYQNPFSKVDALGEYPEDGKWGLYIIIAQHWIRCCEKANEAGRLCWGIGRPPNDYDLETIRGDLQARHRAMEPGSEEWSNAHKKEVAIINDIIAKNKQRQSDTYDAIFDDAIMPTLRRVYNRVNPAKSNQVDIHRKN